MRAPTHLSTAWRATPSRRSDHKDGLLRFTQRNRPWPGTTRTLPPIWTAIRWLRWQVDSRPNGHSGALALGHLASSGLPVPCQRPAVPSGIVLAAQAAIWLRLWKPGLVRMCWTWVSRGALGDVQQGGDLAVGEATAGQFGDLALAPRAAGRPAIPFRIIVDRCSASAPRGAMPSRAAPRAASPARTSASEAALPLPAPGQDFRELVARLELGRRQRGVLAGGDGSPGMPDRGAGLAQARRKAARCLSGGAVDSHDPARGEVACRWPQPRVCDRRATGVAEQGGRPCAQVGHGERREAGRLPCLPGRELVVQRPGPGPGRRGQRRQRVRGGRGRVGTEDGRRHPGGARRAHRRPHPRRPADPDGALIPWSYAAQIA